MSEIPDDIWEAAKATVRSFPHDWVDPLHTKAAVVARAILAERKRCAEVVLAEKLIDPTEHSDDVAYDVAIEHAHDAIWRMA